MTATEKFRLVKRACDEKKVCRVKYSDQRSPGNIHPLGICLTDKRSLVIVCCAQDVTTAEKSWHATVTNLPMEDCDHIKILEERFHVLPHLMDERKLCDDWLFHV